MAFKFNIAEKTGKTFKIEANAEGIIDKKLNDTFDGKEISEDLEGYEFQIAGASDKSGFTAMANIEGHGLKRALLSYGKGFHIKPKREGKKKQSNPTPKGLRMRKTVRANMITEAFTQINLKVVKAGSKPLAEIFPDQNKAPETKTTEAQ